MVCSPRFCTYYILSWIQISQMSWSRVTEGSKNNKNGDILNDLVKQLWSFFAYSIELPLRVISF